MEQLVFRQGYFSDPAALQALADLLQDTFDINIMLQEQFGGPDPTSMPFGYFDRAGRCVANFSAFSMPLVVNGKVVRAAGFQSGAVRPDYRGQGLYRDLMQRAFAWVDEQGFEAGILLTDKPKLYQPYGFATIEQNCFTGPMPVHPDQVPPSRRLRLDDADDVDLIRRIVAQRTPVSHRLAVTSQWQMFLLNACFDPDISLSYLEFDDAVIAWKVDEACLYLLDIAASTLPSLARIAASLGTGLADVKTLFAPDRIDWQGEQQAYAGSCVLMVRGGGRTVPAQPAMLSPMADF